MFCERVKAATAALHAQVQTRPFMSSLMGGSLNVRSYARYVQALQPVYLVLEETMRDLEDPIVGVFDHRGLDRSDRMIADLASFGLPSGDRAKCGGPTPASGPPLHAVFRRHGWWPSDFAAHTTALQH